MNSIFDMSGSGALSPWWLQGGGPLTYRPSLDWFVFGDQGGGMMPPDAPMAPPPAPTAPNVNLPPPVMPPMMPPVVPPPLPPTPPVVPPTIPHGGGLGGPGYEAPVKAKPPVTMFDPRFGGLLGVGQGHAGGSIAGGGGAMSPHDAFGGGGIGVGY